MIIVQEKDVAVYLRTAITSSDSISLQKLEIEKYLESLHDDFGKLNVVTYVDSGYGGDTLNRPGLTGLREDVTTGKYDLLVVTDVTRLSRSPEVLRTLLAEFDEHGVVVESCDTPNLASEQLPKDEGENSLIKTLMGTFAKHESQMRSEKIKAGLKRRKNNK